MKKNYFVKAFLFAVFTAIFVIGCDDDDENRWTSEGVPTISIETEEIHSQVGLTIRIEADVTDAVGLSSITLNQDDWYLDKTISFDTDSIVKSYNLWYDFEVPDDANEETTTITITAENLGGDESTEEVTVYWDGDFDEPEVVINSPADGLTVSPEEEISLELSCDIKDERQLGYIIVEESSLGFYDSISFMGTGLTTYSYLKSVTLPAETAEYSFAFSVADSAGNVVYYTRSVEASLSYSKMYLADVDSDEDLVSDLFGVPMVIETTGTNQFEAYYYAEEAGAEVRFIPQTSSFSPHCFGIDPDDDSKLIDSEDALPIVLSEVGYYKIVLDVDELTYSFEKYTPDDDYFVSYTEYPDDDDYVSTTYVGELGLVGSGFPEYPDQNWSTAYAITFERDENNLYRFYKTLDMEGTVEFIFSPEHPWGWWPEPYWRFDDSENPEITIKNGGDNVSIEVETRTTYKVVFDSHLCRTKVVKVD